MIGNDDWIKSLSSQQPEQLPSVKDLKSFICNNPSVPIPVDQRLWTWIVQLSNATAKEVEEISKLFAVNRTTPCTFDAGVMIYSALACPETNWKKAAFVSTWNNVFRRHLKFLCPEGKADRDTNYNSCTGAARPDFLFYTQNICVLRAEEKAEVTDIQTACEEICNKMEWRYGNIDYLLVYVAGDLKVELLAIINPDTNESDTVTVERIAQFHLSTFSDRLKLFRAVLNISMLLPVIAANYDPPFCLEFNKIKRDCGVVISTFRISVRSNIQN